MIWQPEFTDKILSRKPGAVHEYTLVFTVVIGDVCPQHIDDSVFTGEALLSSQTGQCFQLALMSDNTVVRHLRTERRLCVLIQSVHDSVCLSGQATSQDRKLYGLQQLRGFQNVDHASVDGTDHILTDVHSVLLKCALSESGG
ncbi:transposase [Escherichia coli]|nr:transposase [Escherichia coli]